MQEAATMFTCPNRGVNLWGVGVGGSPLEGGKGEGGREDEGVGRQGGEMEADTKSSHRPSSPKRTESQQPGVRRHPSAQQEKPLATRLSFCTRPVTLMALPHCAAQAGASPTSWALVLRG